MLPPIKFNINQPQSRNVTFKEFQPWNALERERLALANAITEGEEYLELLRENRSEHITGTHVEKALERFKRTLAESVKIFN